MQPTALVMSLVLTMLMVILPAAAQQQVIFTLPHDHQGQPVLEISVLAHVYSESEAEVRPDDPGFAQIKSRRGRNTPEDMLAHFFYANWNLDEEHLLSLYRKGTDRESIREDIDRHLPVDIRKFKRSFRGARCLARLEFGNYVVLR